MRILVIGASGFMGARVAARLVEQGHDVYRFHRNAEGRNTIRGDRKHLGDYREQLQRISPEVVIDMILSSEAQATELMSIFRGVARRVVAPSSADVYRACGVLHGKESGLEPVPLTEDSRLRSYRGPYPPELLRKLAQSTAWLDDDYDKIPVEKVVLGEPDLPGTVLRLPLVYGAGDPYHRLWPIVKRIDDRRPALILEERHAAWRACRGLADNVAAAIVLAATDDRAAGRVYNVADPANYSELEWTRLACEAAGWEPRILVLPQDRLPAHLRMPYFYEQHWSVNSSRIREELGYAEQVSALDGLREAVEWERSHPVPVQFDYEAEDQSIRLAGMF